MTVTGSNTVAAELDRVAKSIDSTAISADRTAVAVESLDRTLLALAGAMDKEIVAADRSSTANNALGDSYKFVAVSSEQSVASINASTTALERHSMAATTASGKMRAFAGSATATGLIKASKWIAGGALVTGYESIKKYMSFQQIVTQSVTEAGVPLKDQKAAMAGLLDISRQTGAKADDMAHIYYRVASSLAGTHAPLSRMLEISKQIADLNLLGNVPTGQQSEGTARVVMSIYNANLKDTGHNLKKTIGTISAIAGSSDAYIKDVSVAFGNGLLAAAQQQGLGMNEAGAIFAAYTKLGMKPSSAGVYATRAITQLFSPTVAGSKGFGMLGIDAFKMKKIEDSQGLGGVLKYLNQKLEGPLSPLPSYAKYKGSTGSAAAFKQLDTWFNGSLNTTFQNALGQKITGAEFKKQLADNLKSGKGMTEQDMSVVRNMMLTRMFGGQRGSVQVAALLDNLPSFIAAYKNINKNATDKKVDQLTDIARKTPGAQLKIIEAKINADFIRIGEIITPIFLKLAIVVASVFNVFVKFKPIILEVVGVLGEVLLLGIALKTLRTGLKIFDFFKTLKTTKLRDAVTNTKATEPMMAAGTTMERAAGIEMEAASLNLRAAEMSAFGGSKGGLMLPGSRGPAEKGLYLPGYSYPGRKPIGIAYAETTNPSRAAASSTAYMNQGEKQAPMILGGVERAAESTTVATAEKVGIGAMAKGALSSVGDFAMGPYGMLAMTLAPMMIPLIGKLGSFLFGGGGTPAPKNAATQTSIQKAIEAAKKQAAKDKLELNKNPKDLKTLNDYWKQQNTITRSTGNLRGKWAANNFAWMAEQAMPKLIKGGRGFGSFMSGDQAETDKLIQQLKKNPQFAKYIKQIRPAIYAQLMGVATNELSSKNAKVAQAGFQHFVSSRTTEQNASLGFVADNKNQYQARVQVGMQARTDFLATYKKELSLSKDKNLSSDLRTQYANAAKDTRDKITELGTELRNLSKENKGQMSIQTISELAKTIAKENKSVYADLGFTPEKFAQALQTAITSSAGSFATIVNKANHSGITTQN